MMEVNVILLVSQKKVKPNILNIKTIKVMEVIIYFQIDIPLKLNKDYDLKNLHNLINAKLLALMAKKWTDKDL